MRDITRVCDLKRQIAGRDRRIDELESQLEKLEAFYEAVKNTAKGVDDDGNHCITHGNICSMLSKIDPDWHK